MIQKFTQANAYLNGQSLLGKVDEVDLGTLKQKMEEFKALGLQGVFEVPSGFEKMEAKVKFKSFDKVSFLQVANFTTVTNLTIRGNQEKYNSLGKTGNESVIVTLNGIWKEIPLGKYAQNEVSNLEASIAVWNVTITIGGVPLLVVDYLTNTFKVGALSLLDNVNKNL